MFRTGLRRRCTYPAAFINHESVARTLTSRGDLNLFNSKKLHRYKLERREIFALFKLGAQYLIYHAGPSLLSYT